jgi:glutamate-ammonia-ligase adenylyltransferase
MEPTPSQKKEILLEKAGPSGSPGRLDSLVAEHCRRLDADYFSEFSVAEVESHLSLIAGLTPSAPYAFQFSHIADRTFGLTVVGEDVAGFFAALSGVLVSHDLDIRVGKVFSYAAEASGEVQPWPEKESLSQGKIIDYLVLERPRSAPTMLDADFQNRLTADLLGVIGLLRAREIDALRRDLYRRIGAYLDRKAREQAAGTDSVRDGLDGPQAERLPLEITIETDERSSVIIVHGADRKALLFSLSNALAMQGVAIQKLLTRAEGSRFEDRIHITDSRGRPIQEAHSLERIKVAIILMERFLTTLPQASDYPAAVQAFNGFIDALMAHPAAARDLQSLEDLTFLSSLARILGAGAYLWEEMTKLPLGEVTSMLHRMDEDRKPPAKRDLEARLQEALDREASPEARAAALNRFKDLQLFRIEAVHLIYPHKTLQEFSAEITTLAEVVLQAALGLAYGKLVRDHGEPRLGKEACPFALFAQGKLGGRELGYASDLEVQLLYAAPGETSGPAAVRSAGAGPKPGHLQEGPEPISHAEFFGKLMAGLRGILVSRTEGIFELDLRLRPHGESGPLASQFGAWLEYYRPGGGALDYERQALLKLSPVTGNRAFAEEVMAARDSLLFGPQPIPIANSLDLRQRQAELLGKGLNAKFSPGGLVEVEYTVQFLQLQHGRKHASLREPNTESTLEALLEEGILEPAEFEILYRAYIFLRRLINGLRMVRGHARDLLVPPRGSDAFNHLAKRLGYLPGPRYDAESQLDWDLKHAMRDVRDLFRRRFMSASAETPETAEKAPESLTAAFLDPNATPERLALALDRLGLPGIPNAASLLRGMLDLIREKGILGAVLLVAAPKLRSSPDPESVLRHLGQYLEAVPDPDYLVRQLLNHPYLNEILIKAFGHSDYLAGILLRQPEYLMSLGDVHTLEKPKLLNQFRRELLELPGGATGYEDSLDALRRYRNREYLRIALRDIWLGETLLRVTLEISQLSNALIEAVFGITMAMAETSTLRDGVAVIALGKLGGNELNYSSDIDIVFVYDSERVDEAGRGDLERWARMFIAALSGAGGHGKMFRVDTQLRPYGAQSPLMVSLRRFTEYFRNEASGWELQAWLKARPVAGKIDLGRATCRAGQAEAVNPGNRVKVETSMRAVRQLGLDKLKLENRLSSEVKLGPGGIRTIEFFVQFLQIQHGHSMPELISGNTLAVMARLYRYRLLSHNYYDLLSKAYVFLRRIEHVLQLQGLQQRHELPASPEEFEKLAKRLGFEERLGESAGSQFRARYRQHMLTLLELSATLFGYETNIPEAKP